MLEAVKDTYSSFSVSAISIYRYLREERNEMKISGRITSLIMEMDDLLEVPSKDNLEKALSNTKMILQNIERTNNLYRPTKADSHLKKHFVVIYPTRSGRKRTPRARENVRRLRQLVKWQSKKGGSLLPRYNAD